MGCFDTYIFKCPWCGQEVEDQVKPGYMNTYRFGEDPIQDLDMVGDYRCNDGCKKSFRVMLESIPRTIIVKDEE